MSRPTIRRLANIEKQAATVLAAVQYPSIPPLSERRGWTLQQHQELYARVLRGEYSESPDDVESRKKIDWEGKTLDELAEMWEQSCRETWDEIRRESETWRDTDFPEPLSPR